MSIPGIQPGFNADNSSKSTDNVDSNVISTETEQTIMDSTENITGNIYSDDVELTNEEDPQYLNLSIGMQWSLHLGKQDLVGQNVKLYITVLSGICEILGTELANDVEYCFQDWNFGVLAIEDSRIKWRVANLMIPLNDPFLTTITPNATARYIYNLHFAIEKLRYSSFMGPKMLILGDHNTGKTSLARTLSSYSIKNIAYQPMFINLDPGQPIVSPPGCLMATPISDLIDLQSPFWNESLTSGATKLHSRQPLLKCFGLENIEENIEWYKESATQLLNSVVQRLINDSLVQRSGCIIDTPSCFYEEYDKFKDILKAIINKLDVDVIVILTNNNEDLSLDNESINELIDTTKCTPIKLPTLSGVIPNDDAYKRLLQRLALRDYFYGDSTTVLSPYVTSCDFTDLIIWRFPATLDQEQAPTPLFLLPVTVDQSSLQHAIVAISYSPKRANPEEIVKSSIMGFALITEVNEKRQKCKLLLPVPGTLPKNALVLTSYRYLE
ncbi:Cleavage polyadenylation factor subunit clp1 [Monosporozyma unispora]|nr:Cleavage polyadenylation factor subunit clp1 [Kazachstania unispora]